MGKELKIATVGTSKIMNVFQEAVRQTPGLKCRTVYSRSLERGLQYAKEQDVPEACDSYEKLLDRDDIDIVYIASPNVFHRDQTIQALKKGKHVIVEKPSGVTEGEVQQMYQAAVENDVFFLEAITTLFMPGYLKLKEQLKTLGEVRSASIAYGRYSSKFDSYLRGENPNIFNPVMKAGALNDMGIYCIHTAVDLFGEPQSVFYTPYNDHNGVDLAGRLLLGYPGFEAELLTSKKEDIPCGCRIECGNGTLVQTGEVNLFENVVLQTETGEELLEGPLSGNRMVYELAAFRDCINSHDTAFFEKMARQSRICSKILELAHSRKD